MQRRALFLLLLMVFFWAVQPVHAADPYATQKNAYITSHPGQTIIPYPWETSTSIRILPFNYEVPAAPGNSVSIAACRNEFESASFVISSQKSLSGIGISVSDLTNGQGSTIPSSATDVRLVKVWYQAAANDVWLDHNEYVLAPELLLKDDSLVRVDYANQINYLKVIINGNPQYIDISTPSAVFPGSATLSDAASLQPFAMAANENKQIWLTTHVPASAPAGEYQGTITINAPSETPVIMHFTVTVLPFDLEPAPLEYSLYYRAQLSSSPNPELDSESKTSTQYSAELQDMKDHGVLYPVLYQEPDEMLGTALTLRKQAGLPTDHIYIAPLGTGTASDAASLANLATRVREWKSITSEYGYPEIYAYGIDEASGSVLESERIAWQTARQNGAKIFVAGYGDLISTVGDLLDVAVRSGSLDTAQAAEWHALGQKIFSYGNPQAGIENAEVYRKNYGFSLWNAGYDGAMNYAYQHAFGNIWNDYDRMAEEPHYRDHVFAYPTSTGVIDTIQWEGWREGVDDTRYLATLEKTEGTDVSARSIVSSSLSAGDSMATTREKVIGRILLSARITPEATPATITPVAGFTTTTVSGTAPLTVTFTDTSINTPTSWSWSFGDGSLVNASARNPVHTYTAPGTYTVTLKATNAAGTGTRTRVDYISVTPDIRVTPEVTTRVTPEVTVPGTDETGTAVPGTCTETTMVIYPEYVCSVQQTGTSASYATLRNGEGDWGACWRQNLGYSSRTIADATTNTFADIVNGIQIYNTSSLPDDAVITRIDLHMYHEYAVDYLGGTSLAIIGTTATGTTSVSAGDYDSWTRDVYAPNTTFTRLGGESGGHYTISFTNLSFINKTGFSRIYTTTPWFVDGVFSGTWGSGQESEATLRTNSYAGTAFDPYFTITYTTGTCGGAAPVAAFTSNVTSGTAPLAVRFTDQSTNTPTSYEWSFGDGSLENTHARNPVHTYTTPGTYSVRLVATNTYGEGSLLKTEYITVTPPVNQPPVLSPAESRTIDEGQFLSLAVTATDPENDPLTYTASGVPAHALFDPATRTFSWTPASDQAGTYTVTFAVSDGELQDSSAFIIVVNDLPQSYKNSRRTSTPEPDNPDSGRKVHIKLV